jgi:hypothetical protein
LITHSGEASQGQAIIMHISDFVGPNHQQ